jgi:hypothetical protein
MAEGSPRVGLLRCLFTRDVDWILLLQEDVQCIVARKVVGQEKDGIGRVKLSSETVEGKSRDTLFNIRS